MAITDNCDIVESQFNAGNVGNAIKTSVRSNGSDATASLINTEHPVTDYQCLGSLFRNRSPVPRISRTDFMVSLS